jgi:hypothetical protein
VAWQEQLPAWQELHWADIQTTKLIRIERQDLRSGAVALFSVVRVHDDRFGWSAR